MDSFLFPFFFFFLLIGELKGRHSGPREQCRAMLLPTVAFLTVARSCLFAYYAVLGFLSVFSAFKQIARNLGVEFEKPSQDGLGMRY